MDSRYDEEYFLRGLQSGRSLYENYRWLPELTVPMAEAISKHCGMLPSDVVLDFGCARGYLVKAFRWLGHEAYGVDVSEWAVSNADPEVAGLVSGEWPVRSVDWVIAKDVMEHIEEEDHPEILNQFFSRARKGIFIVVPLSRMVWKPYVVPEYEGDVTHRIRWPLELWTQAFINRGGHEWEVASRYRIKGIKDNYSQFATGNGFITCRRIA